METWRPPTISVSTRPTNDQSKSYASWTEQTPRSRSRWYGHESVRRSTALRRARGRISTLLDFLVLGDKYASENKSLLKAHKITHVANCASAVCRDCFAEPDEDNWSVRYWSIDLRDSGSDENVLCLLHPFCDFIEEARRQGGRVLVHCEKGVSRSVTMAIAYLMFHLRIDFDQAFALLRKKRSLANPNLNFICQLLRWGTRLGMQSRVPERGVRLARLVTFRDSAVPVLIDVDNTAVRADDSGRSDRTVNIDPQVTHLLVREDEVLVYVDTSVVATGRSAHVSHHVSHQVSHVPGDHPSDPTSAHVPGDHPSDPTSAHVPSDGVPCLVNDDVDRVSDALARRLRVSEKHTREVRHLDTALRWLIHRESAPGTVRIIASVQEFARAVATDTCDEVTCECASDGANDGVTDTVSRGDHFDHSAITDRNNRPVLIDLCHGSVQRVFDADDLDSQHSFLLLKGQSGFVWRGRRSDVSFDSDLTLLRQHVARLLANDGATGTADGVTDGVTDGGVTAESTADNSVDSVQLVMEGAEPRAFWTLLDAAYAATDSDLDSDSKADSNSDGVACQQPHACSF